MFEQTIWKQANKTPEVRLLVMHHLASFQSIIILRPSKKTRLSTGSAAS